MFNAMNAGKLTLFNIAEDFPSVISLGFGGLLLMGLILAAIAYALPSKLGKAEVVQEDRNLRLSQEL